MEGKAGAIMENGEQVGGFLCWQVESRVDESRKDRPRFLGWNAQIEAYWLDRPVTEVVVVFCDDHSTARWEAPVVWPTHPPVYGQLIVRPVAMTAGGKLEAKQ